MTGDIVEVLAQAVEDLGLDRRLYGHERATPNCLQSVTVDDAEAGGAEVFIDFTARANEGDDKAYEYGGRWHQALCATFEVALDDFLGWDVPAMHAALEDRFEEAMGRLEPVDPAEPIP